MTYARFDNEGRTLPDHDEYYRTLVAIEAAEHHWRSELPKRNITVQFATESKRHVTGYTSTVDRFTSADDYWVEVVVDGFHTTHHGLQAAEDYLEGQFG